MKKKTTQVRFRAGGRKGLYDDVLEKVRRLRPGETEVLKRQDLPKHLKGVSIERVRQRLSTAVHTHIESAHKYRVRITTDSNIGVECLAARD